MEVNNMQLELFKDYILPCRNINIKDCDILYIYWNEYR